MTPRGKVARVISPFEVAFNVGSEDGVKIDDIATAYEPVDIHDPDSDELLGTLERPIIQFKVATVGERISAGLVLDTVRNPEYDARAALNFPSQSPARLRKAVTTDEDRRTERIVFVPIGCPVKFQTPEPPKEEEELPF